MKTYKLNLHEGKDIIIQVPDGLETTRDEVFTLATMQLQEEIANGNVEVTERVWPCIYCDTEFSEQGALAKHLRSHETLEKRIKEKLAHLYEKPEEDIAPTQT